MIEALSGSRERIVDLTEFTVETAGGKLSCTLASPEKSLFSDESGLLLNAGAMIESDLHDPSENNPPRLFLEAGHHVVCFDLPHHGKRVGEYGESLDGMSNALMAGNDPFQQFVADGKAVLDSCIKKGIGSNGKVVAYGASRNAYCCLRLAAEDTRIRAVAGVSPVTDWGILAEFARFGEESKMKEIRIENWADQLADRAVYLAIGSQDERVGTESCIRFARKLFKKQRKVLPEGTLLNQLHVVDSPGHSPEPYWQLDGARYLLRFCERL